MKKAYQIFIYFSIILSANAQQSESVDFLEDSRFEKVMISNYHIQNKTFSPPKKTKLISLDSLENNTLPLKSDVIKNYSKKIAEHKLTRKEIKRLLKKIKKELIPIYSMDNNENVIIDFYKDNRVFQQIIISTNTKNIKVKNINCGGISTINESTQNDCIYLGQMNSVFECYLYRLLRKKKMI